MAIKEETTCKNWFMKKSGKNWIYGCTTLVATTLVLAAPSVLAEETIDDATQMTEQTNTESDINSAEPNPLVAEVSPTSLINSSDGEAVALDETPASSTPSVSGDTPDLVIDSPSELQTNPTKTSIANNNSEYSTASDDSITETPASSSFDVPKLDQETSLDNSESWITVSNIETPLEISTRSVSNPLETGYQTNLENLTPVSGIWEERSDGLYSNAVGKGDNFLQTTSFGKNFTFETDVTFLQNVGAASLIFRSNNDMEHLSNYTVNLDANSHKAELWRWGETNLTDEKEVPSAPDNKYHLKVTAVNGWLSYYVNGVLVANLGDHILQYDDRGQNTYIPSGYFGLLNWNGEMIFQNTYYTELDDTDVPLILDIAVTSESGEVEKKGQFFPEEPTHIQYASNEADTINLNFTLKNNNQIKIIDAMGKVYSPQDAIPIEVGRNDLIIESTVIGASGEPVTLIYRLNVHRRQVDGIYYNEPYRDQYHYSIKDGWGNDLNGLVYYKGTYHMFHQFYDDNNWGPMHWAHMTSKDLITWEEQPIALYPDANGTMFSGCIVVDDKNTSGLFDSPEGGLVAIITVNGEGQRIKLAYSNDEGKTWNKVDKIAVDWSEDPLDNRDFRDPKVFRWEDKWFMVIAGGPLRIYSSDNLRDWTVESTYTDLHTECPDLYPLQADDGSLKWVLSRGGRYYKVGNFTPVDGKWTFVPDVEYQDRDEVMNFGKDSYAAMTYYIQSFGTSDNPTIPELIEGNWMNTWDYCRIVGTTLDQEFNGTYNLNLKLGLVKDGDVYRLTQTPIDAYTSLRNIDQALHFENVEVSETNTLLDGFESDSYEIVSTFSPKEGTKKVGFDVRVGDGELTRIVYDLETEILSIDRSQSGVILNSSFAEVNQQAVRKNADGSIDLHLFVDRASVEVFAKGNTVAGANQIFPAPDSLAAKVFVEGESTNADIAIYPLKTIWKDKVTPTEPVAISSTTPEYNRINVGDQLDLSAYLVPFTKGGELVWKLDNADIASLDVNGNRAQLTSLAKGKVTITVSSKENPDLVKKIVVDNLENNFNTNFKDLRALSGDWLVDDETLFVENRGSNDIYMSGEKVTSPTYALSADIKFERGLVNLFFASEKVDPAQAYSIQLGSDNKIRLFRFYGDTIAESSIPVILNDNTYHRVTVMKGEASVEVIIDGVSYLNYQFDDVEPYFTDAYVGIGIWDGAMEVQNLWLTLPEKSSPEIVTPDKVEVDIPEGENTDEEESRIISVVDSNRANSASSSNLTIGKLKIRNLSTAKENNLLASERSLPKSTHETKLPETSSKNNNLLIALGLSLLGLVGFDIRKKKNL
ncbi:glycosyl hydrolase family 32 [Streptococcus pluranimalium]|uniref:Glycosyl hydrolase family 32 n=2 Tax=Streptococcus pluranimalium TaxID=82348 RepID=A0A2L0D259_9STRE|nr:glycosyl hydrolase family 32 [Streptococcus pluranimalium]